MQARFHGTFQQLKDLLLPLNLDGDWEEQPNRIWKFRCRDRAGVLWSETKGTVWFDGPSATKDALAAKVEAVLSDGAAPTAVPADSTIFVVHDRDHEARDQLELVLRRLGLEPFVLQITGGGGDTLIEALEKMIGKSAQSTFGIVLVTPDDMGYLKTEKPEDAKPRARQNVIMEMGDAARVADQKTMRNFAEGICGTPLEYGRGDHPFLSMIMSAKRCRNSCSGFRTRDSTWTLERSVARKAEHRKAGASI